ncbi:protein of unknown function [Poseidonocella pacifica]|uniref:DUF1206 domain-containing protein n=1 Tax=Poseidonocella pacifica TaxID=871651 RepID=A0A1I0VB59_9RHOB|nr:DUF1206 domain-containing protein [Poseidonocella pacifica]SFA72826.1 protein of unknown function [Poseidonocella pacifica]
MADKAPAWVVPVMRAGYGARGLVYTIVGGLAVLAAVRGSNAQGTTNALADLKAQSWGTLVLWIIAVGLVAYAVWRFIDAAMDLEDHGHDAKGIVARTGQVVTGLIHGALGISVAGIALGGNSGSGGGGAQDMTARLMQMPFGPWIVGFAGVCTIGAGIYYVQKGVLEKYKRNLRLTSTTQKLDPALKAGLIAEGIVVAIIGVSIVYAAVQTNPAQAGGVGQALDAVRSAPFGRVLLGILALGLMGFGVENFVEAIYRIVPRRSGTDVETLAMRAKAKARAMT